MIGRPRGIPGQGSAAPPGTGSAASRCKVPASGSEGVPGCVLDVVAGLLDVGLGLLRLALGLELLVTGELARGLLDLADRFFGPVLDPVAHCHVGIPPARRRSPRSPLSRRIWVFPDPVGDQTVARQNSGRTLEPGRGFHRGPAGYPAPVGPIRARD